MLCPLPTHSWDIKGEGGRQVPSQGPEPSQASRWVSAREREGMAGKEGGRGAGGGGGNEGPSKQPLPPGPHQPRSGLLHMRTPPGAGGGQGVGGLQGDLEEPPVGRQGPHPCVEIQLPSENLKHKHRCYGITLWHKSPQLR